MNEKFYKDALQIVDDLTGEDIRKILTDYNLITILPKEPEPSECKGLVYRYKEFSYPTLQGGFRSGHELKPQKRLSCTGCDQCYGILAYHADMEYQIEIGEGIEDGDLVELHVVVDSTDWETGYVDDWHVAARKLRQ